MEGMAMEYEGERRAKLFWNGRSQAVRLPLEFRFSGTEVRVWREGNRVVLGPVEDAPVEVPAAVLAHADNPWEAARRGFEAIGPVSPEFAAMLDEAEKKMREGQS